MLVCIDYDAGNIKSVTKACEHLGFEPVLSSDPADILSADHLILPGVGAFGAAMEALRSDGLDQAIIQAASAGIPLLGICLGLQLLFDASDESPGVRGLGILPGRIKRIPESKGLPVPHMGWNSLELPRKSRLFEGMKGGECVYFVHSYYLKADDPAIVSARVSYGVDIDAAVESGNIYATQFHPEKSGEVGLGILRRFLEI